MNAHARHVTGAQALSVRGVVQMMYDDANGDLTKATDMVASYVAGYPRLITEMVRYAARSMLNEIGQAKRYQIVGAHDGRDYSRMTPAVKAAQQRALASGAIIRETFYDLPYKVNGVDTKLGDMTGAEVEAEGQRLLGCGTKMVRDGRWLISVAAKVGTKRVRDAIKIKDLARLKAEADESA